MSQVHLRHLWLLRPTTTITIPVRAKYLGNTRQQDGVSVPKETTHKSEEEAVAPAPIRFSTSEAYVDYKSTRNFYGGDDRDLPTSHNYVLAGTGIFAFYYLIFLRDDIEHDGGAKLFSPLHETVPQIAIPLLQASIVENRRQGRDTSKLEKKLAELIQKPESSGLGKRKLVEN